MDTFLYIFYAIAYVVILIWSLRATPSRFRWSLRSFVHLVIMGLIFDNAVIASGKFIGEGDFLAFLHEMRYWFHAFITPTLVLYALGLLRLTNEKWRRSRLALSSFLLITAGLIIYEIQTGILNKTLEPVWKYGVLRYYTVASSSGPPIMILLVMAVLLVTSILLWKLTKWPWMFGALCIILVLNMIPFDFASSAVTNGFELLLMLLLVVTKRHYEKISFE
ncbi:membrane-associated phospholipid phosphatase [Oceanobacillus picturae]|uniref:Membrane-associated phospholipid phosphatase n=1 Tax=Oceanobacillus picturae TaxID=171693 RepID=A0A0U9H8W6_9BACI|nr:hypothetical protein [Oceanobacillus picturae]GAQ17729.1 membrane-associated phospholipid phosphatase [Oceanobacillus picturae]